MASSLSVMNFAILSAEAEVFGGLPGRIALIATSTTKRIPPSAPHRSHLLSSTFPPCRRLSFRGWCSREGVISRTEHRSGAVDLGVGERPVVVPLGKVRHGEPDALCDRVELVEIEAVEACRVLTEDQPLLVLGNSAERGSCPVV